MTPEILLNAIWVVWVWTAAAAGCVLLLRRRPAVLRRQLCRLGLVGVPVAMLGAGLWHANRPGAGLWVRRIAAASIGAPSGPAPLLELPAGGVVSWPLAAADDLPTPGAAALEADHLAAPPPPPGEFEAPPHVAAAEAPQPRPALVTAGGTDPPRAGEPWQWPASLAGAVSLVMLLALAARQLRLTMWRRTWRPAAPAWQSLTARLARRIGMRRPVRAFTAERLRHPAAAGIINPAILLPKHYPQPVGLGLRGVLAHELAHLRGRDPLWNLISGAVLACAWWCPLTWWLHRRARIESELTADDHALAAGATPMSLAETLARLAEASPPRPGAVLSGMSCHLTRRIKMMLDERIPHSPRSPLGWRLGLTAAMWFLCATLIATPLVGVVRADEPKPAAVEAESTTAETGTATAPATDRAEPADVAGTGADSDKARVTARLTGKLRRGSTTKPDISWKMEVVSLRISVKGDQVVIETADGKRIVADKIVYLSTSDAGKTRFDVRKYGDHVFIVTSSLPTGRRMPGVRRTTTRPAGQVRAIRIYTLQHTKAAEIAPIVARVWEAQPDVKITPDRRTNNLLVQGTRAQTEAIAAMLKKLDVPRAVSTRPAGPPREVKVYPLKYAKAADLVRILTRLFDPRPDLKITSDPRTNTIVVGGTQADMERIEGLLVRLDVASSRPRPGEKVAPKKVPERPAAVRDAQLRALLGEAERRVIDLEVNRELAALRLVRVQKAHRSKAATAEEVTMAKIKFDAAKRKLDSATKELKELRQLVGGPPPARGAGTPRRRG